MSNEELSPFDAENDVAAIPVEDDRGDIVVEEVEDIPAVDEPKSEEELIVEEALEPEPEPEPEPKAPPVPVILPLEQLKKTNRCPDCNLEKADLHGMKLEGANLSGANLSEANLSDADLSGANLSRANLIWSNLKGANLTNADIGGADFRGAELAGAMSPNGTKCTQDTGSECLE